MNCDQIMTGYSVENLLCFVRIVSIHTVAVAGVIAYHTSSCVDASTRDVFLNNFLLLDLVSERFVVLDFSVKLLHDLHFLPHFLQVGDATLHIAMQIQDQSLQLLSPLQDLEGKSKTDWTCFVQFVKEVVEAFNANFPIEILRVLLDLAALGFFKEGAVVELEELAVVDVGILERRFHRWLTRITVG